METNLGMDRIQERPVEKMIAGWKRIVEREEKHQVGPFSMFYVAGSDQKQAEAIDYFSEILGIGENDRLMIQAEPRSRDIQAVLFKSADRIKDLKGERILVIVKGFEEAVNNGGKDILFRFGHDWDQDVVENANNRELGKLYNGMKNTWLLLLQLDFLMDRKLTKTRLKVPFRPNLRTE